MEEGEDDGDEAEGGLMVHRGAEVIMHGKGTFPCEVVCYNVPQIPIDPYICTYLCMCYQKGCFYNYDLCQSRHHHCVQSASTVRASSALQGVFDEPHFPGQIFKTQQLHRNSGILNIGNTQFLSLGKSTKRKAELNIDYSSASSATHSLARFGYSANGSR